ncbi:type VII secretion protein EccB [Pseudonocardia phyllosphaerae]|uniref:type VII secretion protein EccB n=1 Tax=Pseudonocardia phyllosphaerae TaxID=3390502 RepID=UPI00397BE644
MSSEPGRAPATRDQADAYRFGERRLEAALVRGDAVLAHEGLRSRRRAVVAGVVAGALSLVVAGVLARADPAPDWRRAELVRGERTGVLYAVATGPDRLVPVPDPVAGRLVLAALGRTDGASAVPVVVPDAALATAPRTPPAAVPPAVGVPLDGAPVPSSWAACDSDGATTVLAGALAPGPDPAVAPVLLTAEGGATYLVHDGVRHRTDTGDSAVVAGLGLRGVPARRIAAAVLSAIPEGAPLRLPGTGEVVTSRPLGAPELTLLDVDGGLAPIPVTLADALLARSGHDRPTTVPPGRVASAPVRAVPGVEAWPRERASDAPAGPVLCATWRDGRAGLVVGDRVPAVPGGAAVPLTGADGAGPRADTVVLPPSGPGPLRSGVDGSGARWLLTASGAVYGVADELSARAVGVEPAPAAPAGVLGLLPRAGVLDVRAAREVGDVPR